MSIVSEIPITKTHSIKWCSWGTLCLLLLALITLLIPFFLVFIQGKSNPMQAFLKTPSKSISSSNSPQPINTTSLPPLLHSP